MGTGPLGRFREDVSHGDDARRRCRRSRNATPFVAVVPYFVGTSSTPDRAIAP